MKKLLLITCVLSVFVLPANALNTKGQKSIWVNVYGQYTQATEAELYTVIYDMKYKSYMDKLSQTFVDVGIDPSYFMDDIKASNDCYADAFAKSLSVSDFEILMSNESSDAARDGIINNIANKEALKCRTKYMPYLDNGIESILPEYVSRKCALIKDNDKVLDCMGEVFQAVQSKLGL